MSRTMNFESWQSPETPEMRDALKELRRISPVAGSVMQNYIGSGDYEDFGLRGEPALEVRLGGLIPDEIKKLIPIIIGKQRVFPDAPIRKRYRSRNGFRVLTKKQIEKIREIGTKKQIAEKLHITKQTIIDLMNGKRASIPNQTYTKVIFFLNGNYVEKSQTLTGGK